MFWLYRIAKVERLKLENEMLKREIKKLAARLEVSGGGFPADIFVDMDDPKGDKEYEEMKNKANREQLDSFAAGSDVWSSNG
jgi:hypothetical protein